MTTRLNVEFESRIVRVSSGAGGITRPQITSDGLTRISCLNCGAPGGAVTADLPPALRGDPGVIYICPACDGRLGRLPAHAISFGKES